MFNWDAIASVGTALGGVGTMVAVLRAGHNDIVRKVAEVKEEVKTANAQSLANLADAAESRRISLIPQPERSPQESAHIRESPPPA